MDQLSPSAASVKYTTATLLLAWNCSNCSAVWMWVDTNPDFLLIQFTMAAVVLPPLYSEATPFSNHFKVGYPFTSCLLSYKF